ncbi:MAG TPA: alanyl-tRNA editing protein [Acidimicrobiia bacterium]|nr:alanyl-tRNA editing protein [Acidimicrobiia bacterium]
MTERIYAHDGEATSMEATVVDVDGDAVLLDRTVFYPGGGGQPCDLGTVAGSTVTEVFADERGVWHRIDGTPPSIGDVVTGEIDAGRRRTFSRMHTVKHVLMGVIRDLFDAPASGGASISAEECRIDFDLPGWQTEYRAMIEEGLARELAADHPIEISFMSRAEADADPTIIGTRESLLADDIETVRIVDIVGIDRQADGGTHVRSTAEVGAARIRKVENKGKGFRRFRIVLDD